MERHAPHASGDLSEVLYRVVHASPRWPSALAPRLPHDVDLVLAIGLAKRPDDRFQLRTISPERSPRPASVMLGTGSTGPVGASRLAPRGDVGGTLYRMVHASPRLPSDLSPRLPHDVDLVLAIGLAKRPADRFQSADDLARACPMR